MDILGTQLLALFLLLQSFVHAQVPFSCRFDVNVQPFCNFMVQPTPGENQDNFDWSWTDQDTATQESGPPTGFGGDPNNPSSRDGYLYIETSTPRVRGDRAIITTGDLNTNGDICVEFYYYMYGRHIEAAALRVFSRNGNIPSTDRDLWSEGGDQGQRWTRVQLTVPNTNQNTRVGWVGTRGSDYQSDVAIDDISIRGGNCAGPPPTPSVPTPPPATTAQPTEAPTTRVTTRSTTTTRRITTTSTTTTSPPPTPVTTSRPTTSTTSTTTTGGPVTTPEPTEPPLPALPIFCAFDNGICARWSQSLNDRFNWTWTNEGTPTTNTGPERAQDGNNRGFVYIETSDPRINGDDAILESPPIPTNGDVCAEFYTNMYGENINELSIYTTERNRNSPIQTFTDRSVNGRDWRRREVTVRFNRVNERVLWRAVRGGDIRGDIGMDTITITQGPCGGAVTPPPVTPAPTPTPRPPSVSLPYACTFEQDFCGMFQRTSDNFDWTRRTSRTDTEATGPDRAYQGNYYAYTEMSSPRVSQDTAYIETPNLNQAGAICVRFAYHMYGSDINEFKVFQSNRGENPGNELLVVRGNKGNTWITTALDAFISVGERIVFRSTRGNDVRGDIAIDDIRVDIGNCRTTPSPTPTPVPSPSPGPSPSPVPSPSPATITTCDMERDGIADTRCRIRQDDTDSFQWQRNTGRTESGFQHDRRINGNRFPVTGPENAQSGSYYMYVEASGRRDQDKSRIILEGDDFRRGGQGCLRFFYNMNGFHTGTLSVFVRENNGPRQTVWALAGDQKTSWYRAAVDINMDTATEVGIEATLTGVFSSDIAIDSVQMSQGRCESIPSPYIWICRFETNDGAATWCQMEQANNDQFDWVLWKSTTPSEETGPDRAYNGDYYIYMEASQPRVRGQRARVLLPELGRSGDMCLEFRYNMNGHHMGTLEVFTQRNGFQQGVAWTMRGDQGISWREERVTLSSVGSTDQIGFAGEVGTEFSSDIAIDDLRVRTGRC